MKSHLLGKQKTTLTIQRKKAVHNTIRIGELYDTQASITSNQRDLEIYAQRNSTKMRRLHQVKIITRIPVDRGKP